MMDKKRFSDFKSQLDKLMAEFESGMGGDDESPEHEAKESGDKEQALDDGGQEFTPLLDSKKGEECEEDDKKKKGGKKVDDSKIAMMSTMLGRSLKGKY